MTIIFNILVIGFVLLIAYWWANQGFFSALLHLLAVVGAGAIAFGLWEPLVYLQLSGSGWDNYAWGTTLVGVFALALFILRFTTDRICGANVSLPRGVDLGLGGICGAGAGILTVGIMLIGAGFIQSHVTILGYQGFGRDTRTGQVMNQRMSPMWFQVDTFTGKFFGLLSGGSLYPSFSHTPLATHNPDIWKQASYVRDTFDDGRGQLSLAPDAARVERFTVSDDNRAYVQVSFTNAARDFNEMLTLSASQVRLLGTNQGYPVIAHPDAWQQSTSKNPVGNRFLFDSRTHYATTVPGQQGGKIVFEFPIRAMEAARDIQIRNTRFPLPGRESGVISLAVGAGRAPAINPAAPDVTAAMSVTNRTTPLRGASKNRLPASIEEVDGYFTTTNGEVARFPRKGTTGSPGKNLAIQGFSEPLGTRMIRVDVSRSSPANIFGNVQRDLEDQNAQFGLVDSRGNLYYPMGYIHQTPDDINIKLDPGNFVSRYTDLPELPTSGTEDLWLLFTVTEKVQITGFVVGQTTIGTANLAAQDN